MDITQSIFESKKDSTQGQMLCCHCPQAAQGTEGTSISGPKHVLIQLLWLQLANE